MTFIFLFILGLFIGSFLNVLIDRLPQEKSILGRSHCEFCHHPLSIMDLIPIASFVFLKGKCRYCHKKLSYQYPFIELITGTIFLLTYFLSFQGLLIYDLSLFFELVFFLIVASGLIVLFFVDIKYYMIPDKLTLFLGFVASIFLLFNPFLIVPHLIAGVLGFLFFLFVFVITKGKGWGFGDVKFAFVMGLILGPAGLFIALYIAFLTGALVGIILILWRKKGLKSIIPFAPFLSIGTYISLIFSNQIIKAIPIFQILNQVFLS